MTQESHGAPTTNQQSQETRQDMIINSTTRQIGCKINVTMIHSDFDQNPISHVVPTEYRGVVHAALQGKVICVKDEEQTHELQIPQTEILCMAHHCGVSAVGTPEAVLFFNNNLEMIQILETPGDPTDLIQVVRADHTLICIGRTGSMTEVSIEEKKKDVGQIKKMPTTWQTQPEVQGMNGIALPPSMFSRLYAGEFGTIILFRNRMTGRFMAGLQSDCRFTLTTDGTALYTHDFENDSIQTDHFPDVTSLAYNDHNQFYASTSKGEIYFLKLSAFYVWT